MSGSTLFRKEVLERESSGVDVGRISVSKPRHLQIFAVAAIVLFISVTGLGFFGKYKPSSSVSGIIMPTNGQFDIVAPRDGVVSEIAVREGEAVEKLTTVARVADLRVREDGLRSTEVVREGVAGERDALLALGEASENSFDEKEQGLKRDIETRLQNIDLMKEEEKIRVRQIEIESRVLAQYEELSTNNYVSSLEVSRQRIALDSQNASLISVKRDLNLATAELEQLRRALAQIPLEREMSAQQIRKDLASASISGSASLDAADYHLTSPGEGIVATRLAEPGQPVTAGQPLLTIIPKESILSARLIVPSSSIKSARLGARVALRMSSHPYQKFGLQYGTVSSVSGTNIPPSIVQAELKESSGSYYYVWVELEKNNSGGGFIPGSMVDAEILGDPRPLYTLVTGPLSNAFN